MATESASSSASASPQVPAFQAWWARLGTSGKIMAAGGLVGIIAVFLPLVSMSTQMPTISGHVMGAKGSIHLPAVSTSASVSVISNWRGVFCLLGYLATLALAYFLYQPQGLSQKNLGWAGLALGAFIALLALWLVIQAVSGTSSVAGFGFSISLGFGAILNLLAAAAVTTGGFLKAREEQLV